MVGHSYIFYFQLVELKATLFSKQREVRNKEKTREETPLATKTVSEKVMDFFQLRVTKFHIVCIDISDMEEGAKATTKRERKWWKSSSGERHTEKCRGRS